MALQPGLAPAHAVLARVYLQAGRHREAVEQCRRALDIHPARLDQPVSTHSGAAKVRAIRRRSRRCCSGWRPFASRPPRQERERYRYRLVIGESHEAPDGPPPARSPPGAGSLGACRARVRRSRRASPPTGRSRWRALRAVGASVPRSPGRRRAREQGFGSRLSTAPVETKKYILETIGCGCAFFDYDNDGWMDVFVLGGTRLDGDSAGRHESAVQEQSRRHLHRHHRASRPRRRRAGRPASASAITTTTASRISPAPPSARTGSIATTATGRSPT